MQSFYVQFIYFYMACYIIFQKNNPKLKLQSRNKENAAAKFGHHIRF
jgi:hypothetical protein